MDKKEVIKEFQIMFYGEADRSPIINSMLWMGYKIQKYPTDIFIYQEILNEIKPRLIIETGTLHGGSALFFTQMMSLIHGESMYWEVLSIDIKEMPGRPHYKGLFYFKGSSVDPRIVADVKLETQRLSPVMVVLDSDHRAEHVYKELDIYSQFVTPGSYLIVEDGEINGHPILPRHGPGPWEAVHDWLPKHPEFEIDKSREKFLMTCNPDGYLRRKA